MFRIDWLHAVDQGVGPDFLGNFFVLLMQKMPGNTMEERVHHIWEKCKGTMMNLALRIS